MILKGAPIIHARTFHVDFRSKLLIKPCFFSDADSEYCYKAAVDSTTFRELSPEEGRIVIYAKGDYIIVGKTAVFSDLYTKTNITPQFHRVDSDSGRYAYGFIGAAFNRVDVKTPFVISDEELLRLYIMSIAPRWYEEYGKDEIFDSLPSNILDINVNEVLEPCDEFLPLIQQRAGKIVVDDTNLNRKKTISAVFSIASKGQNIALCTSLYTEKAIRESCFDVVTCKNASTIVLDNNSKDSQVAQVAKVEKQHQLRKVPGHDAILERFSAPSDGDGDSDGDGERSQNHLETLINRGFERNKLKTPNEIKSTRSTMTRERVKSHDDILEQSTVPTEGEEKEGRFRSSFTPFNSEGSKRIAFNQEKYGVNNSLKNMGLILGTIAGVVFIVIETSIKTNPIVLAITGICTVVFAGLEAKNIIDQFRNKS